MKKIIEWLKPSNEATKHRYIVAVLEEEDEYGDSETYYDILHFDGILNRWHSKYGIRRNIMLKEILLWLPLPKIPD